METMETMGANSDFACKANFSSHLAIGENFIGENV